MASAGALTITVAQAMGISGLSRSYLYRKFASGELKRLKAGKRVLLWRADFIAFLKSLGEEELKEARNGG